MSFSIPLPTARTVRDLIGSSDWYVGLGSVAQRLERPLTRAELLTALQDVTQCLGADAAFFISTYRPESRPASHRLMIACDPTWSQTYDAASGTDHDPWLRYSQLNTEPTRASDLEIRGPNERAIVELAGQHGFRSAAILPVHPAIARDRCATMVIGSNVEGYFEHDEFHAAMTLARGLAMKFHERDQLVERNRWLKQFRLSSAELELLACEWRGMSTKAIAAALGITARSIDMRFYKLNVRLRSPSRRASARMAAEQGAI